MNVGAPQKHRETSLYVFNRVQNGGIRRVSYQKTQEQEFLAADNEFFAIINLGREQI